jgi:hypothetical protein
MNLDGTVENVVEANAILEERRWCRGSCSRGIMSGGRRFIMIIFGSGSSMGEGKQRESCQRCGSRGAGIIWKNDHTAVRCAETNR